jgi:hypothetical protein
VTYLFRQGLDYGPRSRGTLGIGLHMTEGSGGLGDVTYLARDPGESLAGWRARIRGVSAHVVILEDGDVWQMVDFGHAAGSFDPDARNPAVSGYYNGEVIREVLGGSFVDPNACSIVAEIAGRRAVGPTLAQVHATVEWVRDMRDQYPTIRGAFGHADQTSTKGCPGTTPNMRAIFDAIGGHGRWEDAMHYEAVSSEEPAVVTVAQGAPFLELDGKTVVGRASAALGPRPSPYGAGATHRAIYVTTAGVRRLVLVVPATIEPAAAVTTVQSAVTAERDRVKSRAIELVGGIE